MPPPKNVPGRGSTPKNDGRGQNGNRSQFRTDTAISNNRAGGERVLQKWVPEPNDTFDGSLENGLGSSGGWDQFEQNQKLFGITTDYDENMYTTAIDKTHPQYRQRQAMADKKAREIERSLATNSHVAEERRMDYMRQKDDDKENEEDKYSGVRRSEFPADFPALPSSGGNKYTPPAKRAPTGQSSVKGAPVDPAIISAQIKAPAKSDAAASKPAPSTKSEAPAPTPDTRPKSSEPESTVKSADTKAKEKVEEQGPSSASLAPAKPATNDSGATQTQQSSASASRNLSPSVRDTAAASSTNVPSATSTVEADVLKEFKNFAASQRMNAEKARSSKARQDKETKLADLKKFASSFKLHTPVPKDLVSIIAKDPSKQQEIQAKALKNVEEMAKKPEVSKDASSQNNGTVKSGEQKSTGDPRGPRAPTAPHNAAASGANRHQGRQQYPQQQMYHSQQQFRNNRGGQPHASFQHQQPGHLSQRLRSVEQQKNSQGSGAPADQRAPPTGPANNADFNRRGSGLPSMSSARLNPNSNEFRPNASAAVFNPGAQPSTTSSPRSGTNTNAEPVAPSPQQGGQLIRRKTKAVDPKKCNVLEHIKTIQPPEGRDWRENDGIRPPWDTTPVWRQVQEGAAEKPDSTMNLTYKQHFERQPFGGALVATPNPQHAMPQMPHQHQLPFHLQPGAHNMNMRSSPHMPHMAMHNPQNGPGQHPPFGNDEHRMMPSSSSQSFASPRMQPAPVAYPPNMGSPYNQPAHMNPGAPGMGYRSFSNNQQFMSPQGYMGGPMMMQPGFMPGPQGMAPHMMYPGGPPQFMPPAGPHQHMPANGYPSPGRPQAPMMAPQGSQQGQGMYGMSPHVPYSQPAYGPGQGAGPSQ